MSRLLTQLRKLESRRTAEGREDAAGPNKMLFVTFFIGQPVDGSTLGPGDEVAVDLYLSKPPLWTSNFCMLEGHKVERVTRDSRDFGVVYDARACDAEHDYTTPPERLTVVGKVVGPGGRIDPCAVEFWNGVERVRRRRPVKARGAAKR